MEPRPEPRSSSPPRLPLASPRSSSPSLSSSSSSKSEPNSFPSPSSREGQLLSAGSGDEADMGAVGVPSYSPLGKKREIEEETKSLYHSFSVFLSFSTATAPNACCCSSNVGALLQGSRRGGRRRRLCSCRSRYGLRVRGIPPRRRLCASSSSGRRQQGEYGRGWRRRRFCRRRKRRHLRGRCCSSSSRRQASRRRGAGRGEGVIIRARASLAKARRGEAPRRERRAILAQS